MFRKASALTITGLFMLATAGYVEAKVLRVGVDLTNPPLQVRDQHGNPAGFVIDITNALCEAINTKCHYVVNSFDAQIPELLARKVDFIMPLGVTPKRRTSIAFSHYVYHDPTVLVARKTVNVLPQASATGQKYRGGARKYSGNVGQYLVVACGGNDKKLS